LAWNDPMVGIEWPYPETPTLSAKDAVAVMLHDAEVFE